MGTLVESFEAAAQRASVHALDQSSSLIGLDDAIHHATPDQLVSALYDYRVSDTVLGRLASNLHHSACSDLLCLHGSLPDAEAGDHLLSTIGRTLGRATQGGSRLAAVTHAFGAKDQYDDVLTLARDFNDRGALPTEQAAFIRATQLRCDLQMQDPSSDHAVADRHAAAVAITLAAMANDPGASAEYETIRCEIASWPETDRFAVEQAAAERGIPIEPFPVRAEPADPTSQAPQPSAIDAPS